MSRPVSNAAVPDRPLALSLLLGISGWVAGGFMLVFVAALVGLNTADQAVLPCLLLLAAAWGLFRVDGDGALVFVTQFALALSIAGQCLALFAMVKDLHGIAPVSGAALLLQVALLLVMPNRLHRTLSTLFALIAWALVVRFGLFGEPDYSHGGHASPVATLPVVLGAWALAWVPVMAALGYAIRRESAWARGPWAPALSAIVTGAIGGLAFATLASYPFESFNWVGGEPVGIGGLALWPLLSAFGALFALMAAFALQRKALMALCLTAALLHVGHFYYALGVSLLAKSLLMLVIGAACLAAAHALRAKEPV